MERNGFAPSSVVGVLNTYKWGDGTLGIMLTTHQPPHLIKGEGTIWKVLYSSVVHISYLLENENHIN